MQRRFDIRVCRGPVCAGERAADAVHARLAALIAARDLGAVVDLERQSCFGRCRLGPNVHVGERLAPAQLAAANPPRKLSAFYNRVAPGDADELLTTHVLAGRVVERLTYRIPAPEPTDTAAPACKDSEPPADDASDPR